MKKWSVYLIVVSMAAMAVIVTACGGGGGGGGDGDSYVAQELSLDAPSWLIFGNLAFDGINFWAHSGYLDSVIFAFDTSGNQVDSIQNPLYQRYSIRSLEYGGGSLWALGQDYYSTGKWVFEISTLGAVVSSFTVTHFHEGGIAYADTMVWVPSQDTFDMFSPVDGSPMGTVSGYTGSGFIDVFTMGNGYFWAIDSPMDPDADHGMHKYDNSGTEVGFYPLDEWGSGITWANGYIWMSRAPVRIDAYDFP